jgi:hypothetical protein
MVSCMVELIEKGLPAGSGGPEGLRLEPPLRRLA